MRSLLRALAIFLAASPLFAAPDFSRRPVDIPAQALSPALETFARERGLQIVYLSEKTNALRTDGVRGEFSSDEALTKLLQGTGLTFHYLDDKTVTIVTPPVVVASGTTSAADSDAPAAAVTIEGRREDLQRQVHTYVRNITRPSGDRSLVRWRVPICPLVAGLPADQGEFILTRLSAIARSVGAPLGARTCRPNFYVVATADATFRPAPSRRRGVAERHSPVRVFYDAPVETADGLPLGPGAPNPQGTANTLVGPRAKDTRIDFSAVSTLASVLVLVDTARAKDLQMGPLADYIAMVGLTELDVNVDVGDAPTILRLFTEAAPSTLTGLSEWDQSFLTNLYTTRQSFRLQRSQIARRMVHDLEH